MNIRQILVVAAGAAALSVAACQQPATEDTAADAATEAEVAADTAAEAATTAEMAAEDAAAAAGEATTEEAPAVEGEVAPAE